MSLPRFSVNQSLFVNLISVILIIIGLTVFLGMNKEIFPNVTFDMVSITTTFAGATPADVEKLISVPIEKELRQVDGIKEINSKSAASLSNIIVELDPDETNKQKVIRDIQSAVDKVKGLPDDVDDPIVTEITSKQYPIIEVSLSGKMSEQSLQKHADALEDIFEDIAGVARVRKSGYREREIQILVDPLKLSQFYVSLDEIESALASRNISLPAGELNTPTTEYSIRTTGEFLTAEEIEEETSGEGSEKSMEESPSAPDEFSSPGGRSGLPANCANCGTELAAGLTECPGCKAPVGSKPDEPPKSP